MMHRFPTRAAALRSLKDISIDAIQHAKFLINEEDGMFCFDEDTAEQYLCSQTETQENTMTVITLENLKTVATSELVAFYNDHAESSIKKFRDRATAEKKVQIILEALATEPSEVVEVKRPEPMIGGMSLTDTVAFAKSVTEKKAKLTKVSRSVMGEMIEAIKNDPTMIPPEVREEKKVEEVKAPAIASKKASTSDREVSATQSDTMKTTLKLDRTIEVFDDQFNLIGSWKNAYQMWKANTEWMTSSQQDGLTAKLYKAAKEGRQERVEINGRTFQLVNV